MENKVNHAGNIFEIIVESAPNAMILIDEEGNISYLNRQAEKIFGYHRDELIGHKIETIIPTRYRERHPDFLRAFFLNAEARPMGRGKELFALRKDGSEFPVEIGLTPFETEHGPLVLAAIIDITERKMLESLEMQAELAKNSKKFQALVENNAEAMVLLDENGIVTYVSPSTERLLGYTFEEFIGKNGSMFFHPDEMDVVFGRMDAAMKNPGKPIYTQNRLRHKDGHYMWTEGTTTNFLGDEHVKAFVGNFRDISERKIAEEKLRSSFHEIETLLDNTDEAFLTLDRNFDIVSFNKSARNIAENYFRKNIRKGMSFLEFIAPERIEFIRKVYTEVLAGERRETRTAIDFENGERIHFHTIIKPIFNSNGETEGLFITERNITDWVKSQNQIDFDQRNLNALINNTSEMMWSVDRDLKLITSNKAFEKAVKYISGKTAKRGINVLEMAINDVQKERWRSYYEKAFDGKTFMVTEYVEKPGEFWSEISFYPIYMGNSTIGTACYSHNITAKMKAESAIRRSEGTRKLIMDSAIDAIICIDQEGQITFWNPSAEKLFGWKEHEIIGNLLIDSIIPEKYVDHHVAGMKHYLSTGEGPILNKLMEITALDRMGKEFPVEITVVPIQQDGKELFCAFIHDITERKLAEEKLMEANRLYAFVSAINQTIVHVTDEQTLFEEACRIAVEIGAFELSWVGIPDEANRKLTLAAKSNAVTCNISILSNWTYIENGPTEKVIKSGEYYVVNDFEKETVNSTSKKYALECGFKSFIALPIRKSGKTTGTFNLFSSQPNLFDTGEIRLLKEISDDISFALDNIEKELLRKESELKLKHSELRLKQAQAVAHIGSWEEDISTGIETWSEETCRIYGLPVDDNKHDFESWKSFLHPGDMRRLMNEVYQSRAKISDAAFHHRIIRRDGSERYIYAQSHFELNEDGIPVSKYGVVHDVTEQKLAEEKIIRVNRMYAFSSQINQTIVHVTDEQTLFNEVCQIAVSIGQFELACIDAVDVPNRRLDLVAQTNATPQALDLFKTLAFPENGAIAGIIANDRFYVINDFSKEPDQEFWRRYSFSREFHSAITLPLKKSGKTKYLLSLFSRKQNIFDEAELTLLGESALDISFALDVFEKERHRKGMEDKVTQSELRLKQAQAGAHFGNWALDFHTGISTWSDEACRIYGLSPDENIQSYESWLSFIHPEDLEQVMKVTEEGSATLSSVSFHHRIIRKTGEVRYIHSLSHFEVNDEGKPVGLYGVAHDETETRAAEEALQQSKANLRLIVDLIPQSIFAMDGTGKFVFVNNSFAALYGLTPKQLVYKSIYDTIPNKSAAAHFIEQARDVIATGKTVVIPELEFKDFTGKTKIFYSTKVPFALAGKNEKAMLGVSLDITDQKRAETERTRMIEDIVQRNKDLEQFSYIVSHNLRAPVANILGIAEVIEIPGLKKADKIDLMSHLSASVKKLDDVIMDLNFILQLKEGVNLQKETVKFSGILDDIKQSVGHIIKIEKAIIKSDFSEVAEMFTLKSYIYSIFYNLITNSIKYRQPGVQPFIEISSKLNGDKLELIFKDNGIGIDLEKKREHVFGLYKRFHTQVEGKGMGLFMVKTQVQTLGGTISIFSELNKGTEFRIEFNIN